jgi:hypothetical protein
LRIKIKCKDCGKVFFFNKTASGIIEIKCHRCGEMQDLLLNAGCGDVDSGWKTLQETGLILIINQILHIFGWAIFFEYENCDDNSPEKNILKRVYPARCKFRGFGDDSTREAYKKISSYMVKNSEELLKEALE